MVTMAQSAANCHSTRTQMDRMHSLTQLHQHSYGTTSLCEAPDTGLGTERLRVRIPVSAVTFPPFYLVSAWWEQGGKPIMPWPGKRV